MDRALVAIVAAVGAAVIVLGTAAVWLTATDGASDEAGQDPEPASTVIEGISFPAIDHDASAADALVEAWARWRAATFVSSGTWTRTLDARPDEPLTGEVYVAQAPPRRLVVRLGSVVERHDGEVAACSPSEQDVTPPVCLAGEGLDYDELVERELDLVRRYVSGATRIYDVDQSAAGCFRAELVASALASPWGRWAEYCFDPETGALRSARIRRPSAIDVEEAMAIRAVVSDDDFG